jgi:hypothetical protein
MSRRSGLLPQDGKTWLLAIGQRLRAEYAALEEPLPERLAALLAQLERQQNRRGSEDQQMRTDRYDTAVTKKAI